MCTDRRRRLAPRRIRARDPARSGVETEAVILVKWLSLVIVAGVLAGCASFHPRPLEAPRVEARFRSRSLTDPGLRAYVESNLSRPLPSFPPRVWDLSLLTLVAFYYNPNLDVARARLGVARAGIITAGALPNPSLGFRPGYNADAAAGVSPWILGFTLDLPVTAALRRGYRISQAEELTDAARLQLAEVGWRVRRRLRAALVDYLVARRRVDLWRQEEQERAAAAALLERRLAVGEAARPEVESARAAVLDTEANLRAAQGRVQEGRAALAAALGLPVSALGKARFTLPGLDAPPTAEQASPARVQRAGLLNRLDVRRALTEYAAAQDALRLEVARQYPSLHLGPGYQWDQGENKFFLGLSITLPLFNRNRGPIAAAAARRRAAAARFLALQARVIAETEKAEPLYRAALEELAQARQSLHLSEVRENAVRRALAVGQSDRLDLIRARVRRTRAARAELRALRKTQEALGALEDAVQAPLGGGAPGPVLSESSPRHAKRTGESR